MDYRIFPQSNPLGVRCLLRFFFPYSFLEVKTFFAPLFQTLIWPICEPYFALFEMQKVAAWTTIAWSWAAIKSTFPLYIDIFG